VEKVSYNISHQDLKFPLLEFFRDSFKPRHRIWIQSHTIMIASRTLLTLLGLTLAASAENWPQWRGPAFNGTSPEKNLPAEITAQSIRWKAELPGFSGATPAIWGDSIFVTSPDNNKDLQLICLDRKDGKVRWQKIVVSSGDLVKGQGNMASPSPVTDGKAVYAMFGTGDLAAYDFDGKELWKRNLGADYGKFAIMWIYGCSPVLYHGKLYVQVLQRNPAPADYPGLAGSEGERESYLLALDPQNGKTLWKQLRPTDAKMESNESYATPTPHESGGKAQLLVVGGNCLTGHDPDTGKELWRGYGVNRKNGEWMRIVPSPVSAGSLAVVCGPKQEQTLAFKTDLQGDISTNGVAWTFDERQTPDVCTPAYSDGKLYVLNGDKQVLICLDAKTGAKLWKGNLGHRDTIRSSPTVADGKVYTISEKGNVVICDAAGPEFKILSTYQFEGAEPTRSAIAISNGQLFVRTANALYCLKGN
jgi:outer membrane protein assembly factor BamB